MTQFKHGDRVRYTGKSARISERKYIGDIGVVDAGPDSPRPSNVVVKWETGESAKCKDGYRGVFADNLELVDTIDTTKPLQLPGSDRAVTFITETSDGNILVDVAGYGWAIFDKHGKFVRAKEGYAYRLGLINTVVTRYLSKQVMVDGKYERVKFTLVDDVATAVELER